MNISESNPLTTERLMQAVAQERSINEQLSHATSSLGAVMTKIAAPISSQMNHVATAMSDIVERLQTPPSKAIVTAQRFLGRRVNKLIRPINEQIAETSAALAAIGDKLPRESFPVARNMAGVLGSSGSDAQLGRIPPNTRGGLSTTPNVGQTVGLSSPPSGNTAGATTANTGSVPLTQLNPYSYYDVYCLNGLPYVYYQGVSPDDPSAVLLYSGVQGAGITASWLQAQAAKCTSLPPQPAPTPPPAPTVVNPCDTGVGSYYDTNLGMWVVCSQPASPPPPPPPPPSAPPPTPPPVTDETAQAITYAAQLLCHCLTSISNQWLACFCKSDQEATEPQAEWLPPPYEGEDFEDIESPGEPTPYDQASPPELAPFSAEAGGAVGGPTTSFQSDVFGK